MPDAPSYPVSPKRHDVGINNKYKKKPYRLKPENGIDLVLQN
jgi:hypothetical protein